MHETKHSSTGIKNSVKVAFTDAAKGLKMSKLNSATTQSRTRGISMRDSKALLLTNHPAPEGKAKAGGCLNQIGTFNNFGCYSIGKTFEKDTFSNMCCFSSGPIK
jgi:hypothetical protein